MRAIALHPDVLVATSAIWQTNCVVVRQADETFVVDSPVLPEELGALRALVDQAGFAAPRGLLVTHGDWDHLLGRLAFPDLVLGCAQSTAARLRAAPGEAQRELREFDEQFAIERAPLALGGIQPLPVPGGCGIGSRELELHPTAGHTEDGMALWVPWARILLAGDYFSPIELPTLRCARRAPAGEVSDSSGIHEHAAGALESYLRTLERLRPLVEQAERVVPGHGPAIDAARALSVMAEDLEYLRELRERGVAARLPRGRDGRTQRTRHAENVANAPQP